MAEQGQMVRLRKETGGSTLEWEGKTYAWGKDDSVTEVPYGLALSLLAVPGGGYSIEGDPQRVVTSENIVALGLTQTAADAGLADSAEGRGSAGKVTEPAADGEHKVTEPAPDGEHEVTEGSSPPVSGEGSPVTPKPRASTRPRKT